VDEFEAVAEPVDDGADVILKVEPLAYVMVVVVDPFALSVTLLVAPVSPVVIIASKFSMLPAPSDPCA
jgi:hypothetical protein